MVARFHYMLGPRSFLSLPRIDDPGLGDWMGGYLTGRIVSTGRYKKSLGRAFGTLRPQPSGQESIRNP